MSAKQCAVVENVLQIVGLLASRHAEQQVAVCTNALLGLYLGSQEMVADVFHVADAGERHLLLYIVGKPFTTDGVSEDGRNNGAEEQSAVEHGLDGEAAAESERHAPVGIHLAQASFLASIFRRTVVELCEVVGDVGIFGLETCTASGEVPIILAIVVQACAVTEEVFVFERHLHRVVRAELAAIVHEVPAQTHLNVDVAQVVVDRQELCLELIVKDAIVTVAVSVDVNIVAAECIAKRGTREATGMDGDFAASHHELAQS